MSDSEVDRSQWPVTSDSYEIYEQIGTGGSATVWRGICKTLNNRDVAIKKINLEETKVLLDVIRKEIMTLGLSSHPNVVSFYTSFLVEDNLWLVMDFMAAGSVLDIMKFKFQGGLDEPLIATILREALKGIKYFHDTERIHRDVKAGNILISSQGDVKLADLGVAAWLMADGERKDLTKTFVGTPCWMAPEVMEQTTGHSFSADIWSLGITALELAHGQVPFAHLKPMKVLLTVLKEPPPTLEPDEMKSRGWSKSFKDMIDCCLQKDPTKRPSSAKLLEHKFFKAGKKPEYIVNNMLVSLPPLGDRFKHALQLQKEAIRGSSPSEIPDDDLAEALDDIEPWDFGDHESIKISKKKKSKGEDLTADDGEESTKTEKKRKKKLKDDSTADDVEDEDDGDDEADDAPSVRPSKREKKEKKSVETTDDSETTKKASKSRKMSKSTPVQPEVVNEGDSGEDAPEPVKKGRFTIVSDQEMEKSKSLSGLEAKTTRKSKSVAVNDDCESCAMLRAQLVLAKKEIKDLTKRLATYEKSGGE